MIQKPTILSSAKLDWEANLNKIMGIKKTTDEQIVLKYGEKKIMDSNNNIVEKKILLNSEDVAKIILESEKWKKL
jgi:hypothetical protein